jgi:hypothetical protein
MDENLFTQNRVSIKQRIKKGLTEIFSNKLQDAEEKARKFAQKRKSYIYPVFDEEGYFVGYGIPK